MRVPGSFLEVDHPFAWYAIVKEKTTGKQWTYWLNGNQLNREKVAEHIAIHYHNVEVITIDRCTKMPDKMLQPIPANHYQFGIIDALQKELAGNARPERPLLSRTTIARRPIVRPMR